MVDLHCLPPSVEPRVSDHMPHIIDMITQVLLPMMMEFWLLKFIENYFILHFSHFSNLQFANAASELAFLSIKIP